ncbi:MAG: hypothetical protein ACIAXF_14390, partial [Phycisphaerales bacterium JB063]
QYTRSTIVTQKDGLPAITVTTDVFDRRFRATAEYVKYAGSYNVTAQAFKGTERSPWIDTQSIDPGPGWEELDVIPEQAPENVALFYFTSDAKAAIQNFGKNSFPTYPAAE